jgi:alpha-ketoglutarate-dependent 2,4-dichlorophenoxyacetate dioxygenase
MSIEKFSTDTVNLLPPVEHSLVREHPYNKLNSLYIASHASHIVGWPLEKGRTLIKDLIDFSTQTKYTYSHDWDLHDFVMWDDRWTMHRATPYSGPHPRKMRQCAVFETEDIF